MEKMLVQAGSAAGAGVLAQYAEKKSLFGATVSGGLVASAGVAALAYFMAPTARGNAVNAASGAIDGAATWLALKYIAPMIAPEARAMRSYSPPPMYAQSYGGARVEI